MRIPTYYYLFLLGIFYTYRYIDTRHRVLSTDWPSKAQTHNKNVYTHNIGSMYIYTHTHNTPGII